MSNEDGLSLKNYYTYDKGYFIIITPDFGHNPIEYLRTYLLALAIVIGICLFIISISILIYFILVFFMVIKCILDRQRSRRHGYHQRSSEEATNQNTRDQNIVNQMLDER